jgi:hypothetical protein
VGEQVQLLGHVAGRVDLVDGGVLEGVDLLDQVAPLVEPLLSGVAIAGSLIGRSQEVPGLKKEKERGILTPSPIP